MVFALNGGVGNFSVVWKREGVFGQNRWWVVLLVVRMGEVTPLLRNGFHGCISFRIVYQDLPMWSTWRPITIRIAPGGCRGGLRNLFRARWGIHLWRVGYFVDLAILGLDPLGSVIDVK